MKKIIAVLLLVSCMAFAQEKPKQLPTIGEGIIESLQLKIAQKDLEIAQLKLQLLQVQAQLIQALAPQAQQQVQEAQKAVQDATPKEVKNK